MSGDGIAMTLSESSVQTVGGRHLDLLAPRAGDVDIRDLAHALSNLCRFGGNVPEFYSVAQHSVLVARYCLVNGASECALWGLLHDASEAFCGDVVWPLKRLPQMSDYKTIEAGIMAAVAERFHLSMPQPEVVGRGDRAVLLAEARDFLNRPRWARERVDPARELRPWPMDRIIPMPPKVAKGEFLVMYDLLTGERS